MLPVLLRPYLLILRNRFSKAERASQNKRRDLLLAVCALVTMLCIFVSTVLVLKTIESEPILLTAFPIKIVQLTFAAFFVMLVISTTLATLGNLYAADNMDLFLYAPVTTSSLFAAKAATTLVETGTMYFVFTSPVALGLMYELGVGPSILVRGLAVSIPFLLIPVGLSFVFATLFARVSAKIWKRGFLLFAAIAVAGAALFYKLVALLNELKFDGGGALVLAQALQPFSNPNPRWSPAHWAAEVVIGSFAGDAPALFYLALLSFAAVVSLLIGYAVTARFLLTVRSAVISQDRPHVIKGIGANDTPRRVFELFCKNLPLSAQLRTIILKDLTSLTRDRGQALQLLLYLGIASAYILLFRFMSLAAKFSPTGEQVWSASLASLNLLLSGFMLTTVLTRLIYPSVSLEGRAFWIVLVSPLRLSQLIYAKFMCWLPLAVIVALSLSASGLAAIHLTAAKLAITALSAFALACGGTGLAVGIGAMFASFEWETPNQISAGLGTLVLLLSNLALVAFTSLPASFLLFIADSPSLRLSLGAAVPAATAGAILLILSLNLGAATLVCRRGAYQLSNKA